MAAQLRLNRSFWALAAGGWALYRYGSLFGAEAPALAEAECAALRALNG